MDYTLTLTMDQVLHVLASLAYSADDMRGTPEAEQINATTAVVLRQVMPGDTQVDEPSGLSNA